MCFSTSQGTGDSESSGSRGRNQQSPPPPRLPCPQAFVGREPRHGHVLPGKHGCDGRSLAGGGIQELQNSPGWMGEEGKVFFFPPRPERRGLGLSGSHRWLTTCLAATCVIKASVITSQPSRYSKPSKLLAVLVRFSTTIDPALAPRGECARQDVAHTRAIHSAPATGRLSYLRPLQEWCAGCCMSRSLGLT
jgi:hypothetical protein